MEVLEHLLRLIAAIAGGALVGFERELSDKPAGFRTNILICFGAALFTILSLELAGPASADQTRIAAQIVTGVGFLGAGTIMQHRGAVRGLTTAATIWAVASIGVAFGGGRYLLGGAATILTTAVLFGLQHAENAITHWRVTKRFYLRLRGGFDHATEIRERVDADQLVLSSFRVIRVSKEEGATVRISVRGSSENIENFYRKLVDDERVREVRRG